VVASIYLDYTHDAARAYHVLSPILASQPGERGAAVDLGGREGAVGAGGNVGGGKGGAGSMERNKSAGIRSQAVLLAARALKEGGDVSAAVATLKVCYWYVCACQGACSK